MGCPYNRKPLGREGGWGAKLTPLYRGYRDRGTHAGPPNSPCSEAHQTTPASVFFLPVYNTAFVSLNKKKKAPKKRN